MRPCRFAVLIALWLGCLVAHAQSSSARETCARSTAFTLPGTNLEITGAEWIAAGSVAGGPPGGGGSSAPLPAHCRVDGVIDRRTGVNAVEYGIRFAVALPEAWNGRFLFQGGGGLNGAVRPPLGAGAAGDTPALARGFAVASTDSGHQGAGFDGSFFADQEAALNFLFLANMRVTHVANALIAEHYGDAAAHAYFVGCSTGGREGMIMTQRFPFLFDGVVSGAPAMRTGHSNLATRSATIALNRAAERDADGRAISGTTFSESDRALIVNALLETCDATDGLRDGMIFNTHGCGFDPMTLICAGEKTDECLTTAQATALAEAFAAPVDSLGREIYPAFPFDTGIDASGQGVIPGLLNPGPSPVGSPVSATEQDLDAEATAVAANPTGVLGDTHVWTNLGTFAANGGKLIFYHGVSDPWFSALDTVQYYERLIEDNGGENAVTGWSRLFLMPGMGHCGGGTAALDRFDLLDAIVDWVENDNAPERVISTGEAFPNRSRPLCPYPTYAHYTGSGDPEDERNFECRR